MFRDDISPPPRHAVLIACDGESVLEFVKVVFVTSQIKGVNLTRWQAAAQAGHVQVPDGRKSCLHFEKTAFS